MESFFIVYGAALLSVIVLLMIMFWIMFGIARHIIKKSIEKGIRESAYRASEVLKERGLVQKQSVEGQKPEQAKPTEQKEQIEKPEQTKQIEQTEQTEQIEQTKQPEQTENSPRRRTKGVRYVFLTCLILAAALAVYSSGLLTQDEKEKDSALEELPIELDNTDYSATDKIEAAKKKLEENPQKANVITNINTVEKKVAICFEGQTDITIIEQILELLKEHDMTATFFLSAVETSENAEAVKKILESGQEMESYTLYGTPHMETLPQEEVVEDFCRAQEVYKNTLLKVPTIVKCNATDYTEKIMETAESCGYESVLYPTNYLNYSSFSSENMAKNYVASKAMGSVIMVKLSGFLDETEYEEEEKETTEAERPAEDKKPGIELHDPKLENLSEDEKLLVVVEWLLTALEEAEYETIPVKDLPGQDMGDVVLKYEEQEELYEDAEAEIITGVHTTDREMSFTFRGLGDEKELDNLLAVLEKLDIRVTFFVTGKEADAYPEQIRKIIEAGHEIGNGGYSGKSMKEMSFGEICEDIYKNDAVLEGFGIKSALFMPPYGVTTKEVQKAAAALEKKLITYTSSPTRTEYVEEQYTAKEVVKKYYKNSRPVFCRGDITYFNMAVYEDETSLAELVETVWNSKVLPTRYGNKEGSILQVCTVSELMDHTWSYPASTNATYYAIGTNGKMQYMWEQALSTGYIGSPYLSISGFTEEEEALLDRTGRINTGGSNTVFLTFDDWGNEATIGKVLYVLRKHNVKASFFIRTQYVEDGTGENLLRAIAEEGHDVASHTNTHMQIDITEEQIPALQQDLVKSNQTLSRIVGNTGRLTDYFRPPTLAVNRIGVSTVFDCGYGQIISADVSTSDYQATSVDDLYDILLNGARLNSGERMKIQDGSVVVMHINPNAVYTAQALDRYLTYVEGLPDGDPNKFNFARLSDYLH